MFHFHKVPQVRYLGEVDIFHAGVKFLPAYNSAKLLLKWSRFSKVMITNDLVKSTVPSVRVTQ